MKLISLALVVNDMETYLSDPDLSNLADTVLQAGTDFTVPFPEYAALKMPFKVVPAAQIPQGIPGQVLYLQYKAGDQYEILGRLNRPTFTAARSALIATLTPPDQAGGVVPFATEEAAGLPIGLNAVQLLLPSLFPVNWKPRVANIRIPDPLPSLPWPLYALLVAAAGWRAYEAQKTQSRILWGVASWVLLAKTAKEKRRNIKI